MNFYKNEPYYPSWCRHERHPLWLLWHHSWPALAVIAYVVAGLWFIGLGVP